jgi:hypothetical protein
MTTPGSPFDDVEALRLPLREARTQVTLARLAASSNSVVRVVKHLEAAQKALHRIEQSLPIERHAE